MSFEQAKLISHKISPEDIEDILYKKEKEIKKAGDKDYVSVSRQLELLDELSQFDFGRFLLQNRGLNGYWIHYVLVHPWTGRKTGKNKYGQPFSDLEFFLLNRAPIILATQQRFKIFLRENQKAVKNGAKLACIPCGLMDELLHLDFTGIDEIELTGIDYDADTLQSAYYLADKKNLKRFVKLEEGDAWQLTRENKFDLISSNGLNIYEPDDNKVVDLYRQFYSALKLNGYLVTSFVTPPPTVSKESGWAMDKIDPKALLLQRIIFSDIIGAKWQCFRTVSQTREQLQSVGFEHVKFLYDNTRMFPTVIAYKFKEGH